MKIYGIGLLGMVLLALPSYAQDIEGVWKAIDDKSGQPKGLIEIKKQADGSYSGKILKLIPVNGFEVVDDICVDCPAPYTNKPMVGMEVLKGLKYNAGSNSYDGGQILDPKIGKIYSVKAKTQFQGKHLRLRGYIGTSILGRSQTWVRDK